jgi:hypothetical protein
MKKELFSGLKLYKTTNYSKEIIANAFPIVCANLFKMFMAKTPTGQAIPIGYDWGKLMEFKTNLGTIIAKENYDFLDNIIIQFLNSYSCICMPYRIFIKFPEEKLDEYTKICDNFKGKKWDDIIDTFIDATYDLFALGTMMEKPLT